ncbi:MAG TPA: hypothetical protein DCF63_03995 [Planctomycetaceae bacterium]|nr:hypothetical protein [Planctomycetaceae bacterium]
MARLTELPTYQTKMMQFSICHISAKSTIVINTNPQILSELRFGDSFGNADFSISRSALATGY